MRELKVEVIKANSLSCWYSGLEGNVFTVYDNRRDYILKEDYDRGHRAIWRHLDKEDVKSLEKSSETKEGG